MNLLIPFLSGLIGWAGGRDKFSWQPDWLSQKVWRSFVMGAMVASLSWTWWAFFTYSIAGYCLHYGEKYQSKYGKIVWFTSGFIYGFATLDLWVGLYCGLLLHALMWCSNTGLNINKQWKLSHPWVEWIFFTLCTLKWVYSLK